MKCLEFVHSFGFINYVIVKKIVLLGLKRWLRFKGNSSKNEDGVRKMNISYADLVVALGSFGVISLKLFP